MEEKITTLIELYDERAIENVLAVEVFQPIRVIFLCPTELAENASIKRTLQKYFRQRFEDMEVAFVETSLYKADHIVKQLKKIYEEYGECAIDVTGGTDAALFAAGMFCQEYDVAAFTYSRKNNCFYDICNAKFANSLPCTIQYRVEDFFQMTGGTLRKGRVDNSVLQEYMDTFELFFDIYMKHRREWTDFITYMQRISQCPKEAVIPLNVKGNYEQKGEHGHRVYANRRILSALEEIGYISGLSIREDQVRFRFRDLQVRYWLRDVGSVLELYIYKICKDLGGFQDVISSAIVDWDGTISRESVSNEIDVVATRGVKPLFVSCKTCEVRTEAVNELAILKDRFGGKGASAIVVTTEFCNAAVRHRAQQLGIAVIDLEELEKRGVSDRIRTIMKF